MTPAERDAPSVRLIEGALSWLRRRARLVAGVLALLLFAALVADGLYVVRNDETAVVRRFGRVVDDRVGPGLHLGFPRFIDEVERVRTGEVLRLPVEGDFAATLSLLTGDENVVELEAVAQVRVSEPGRALFAVGRPEALVVQALRAALVEAVARRPVDPLLTREKAAIERVARERAQAMLERYGAGVTLLTLNLASVQPPSEAAPAFRSVSDARAEAERLVSNAESEAARVLSIARGEAGALVAEAQARARARVTRARGAAERFKRVLDQEAGTPDLLRAELLAERLAPLIARGRVVVLPPGEAPRVDVQLVAPGVEKDGAGGAAGREGGPRVRPPGGTSRPEGPGARR